MRKMARRGARFHESQEVERIDGALRAQVSGFRPSGGEKRHRSREGYHYSTPASRIHRCHPLVRDPHARIRGRLLSSAMRRETLKRRRRPFDLSSVSSPAGTINYDYRDPRRAVAASPSTSLWRVPLGFSLARRRYATLAGKRFTLSEASANLLFEFLTFAVIVIRIVTIRQCERSSEFISDIISVKHSRCVCR